MTSSPASRPLAALLPLVVPPLALVVALAGLFAPATMAVLPVLEALALLAAVFVAVHHAEAIAHRVGEPYGTLVLTVAVTVIEVALIVSIMVAGDGSPTLARDTVLAVVMVVVNGLVGLCIVVGGLRYGEQGFRISGASAYLVVLMPLATLTLILPNYTTSAAGPYYTAEQLVFVSFITVLLYAVFLYVQTVRHRDYFVPETASDAAGGDDDPLPVRMVRHSVLLLIALAAIVLLAKSFGGTIKAAGGSLPVAAIGLVVALVVLLPESIAALNAARANRLQKSLNLALGSSLATIGLTIPAIAAVALILDKPVALGLDARDTTLLILTFGVAIVTFRGGRTNILPGVVHLILFATWVFLIFRP